MRRIALVLLLLLPQTGPAQEPSNPKSQPPTAPTQQQGTSRPGDDDVVKITTNLVQVDAVVTDKSGKLIKDLRPEEVQIFEDGRQQKITSFSLVLQEAATTQPVAAAPVDKTAPQ